MDEKKPIKVRLSTVILCFIIVVLVIVIAFMYFYFTNQTNNQHSDVSNQLSNNTIQSNETNSINTQTSDTETLDINSSLVKKLYNYIPVIDVMKYKPYNAYQTNKVTINNIATEYILGCAFTKLFLTNKDKLPYENEDGTKEGPNDGWFSFKSNILQEKIKELYGQNVKDMDFEYSGDAQGCTYRNGKYIHSSGGYVSQNLISIRKMEKSYTNNGDLIIEDKYIALKHDDGEKTGNETNELFASSDATSAIKRINFTIMEKPYEKISTEIIDTYGNNMSSYKHTFKKNADSSYYWYSTEPLK